MCVSRIIQAAGTKNKSSFYGNCCACRYQKSDFVKLDILLNGQPVDALATIVHNLNAQRIGRGLVDKLQKFIDRFVATRSNLEFVLIMAITFPVTII